MFTFLLILILASLVALLITMYLIVRGTRARREDDDQRYERDKLRDGRRD